MDKNISNNQTNPELNNDTAPYNPKIKLTATFIAAIKKFSNHQNLAEIGWLIAGQLVSIVLGFVTMKLLTSMGTKEFGKYSLVLTIAAFISAILYGPAEQGFLRFYFDYSAKDVRRVYIGLFYKFLLRIGLGLLVIILLAIPLNGYFKTLESASGILIMGLYIVAFCSSNIYNSMLNILRKRKINTILQIAERSLIILLVFLTTLKTAITANTGFLAILISLTLAIFLKTIILNRYVPNDEVLNESELAAMRREMVKVIATFSFPFAIWGITGWMQSNSERWIIAKYLTTADVGIFSVMAILANYLVTIPGGIVSQFMQPVIYENISAGADAQKLAKGYKSLKYLIAINISLAALATLFALLLGKYLILFISNVEFAAYWFILPILCFGAGVFNIAQTLITIGVVRNVPKIYLWPKIITGLFALFSNIFFISRFGIVGIAIAISVTSVFYLIFIIYINKQLNKTLMANKL